MKLKSKDLILHILNVKGRKPQEPIIGITRFQKMVFLFEKEIWSDFKFDRLIPESELPQFDPYYFGPFSEKLNADIEFLCNLGFIDKSEIDFSRLDSEECKDLIALSKQHANDELQEFITCEFSLSSKGKRFVELGKAGVLSATQNEVLEQFKLKCTSVPLGSLLKYVYVKYPSMTVKSQIRKAVLGFNV